MEDRKITCIVCPNSCELEITEENEDYIVKGNMCPRGEKFAINEVKNPKRTVCSTVKTIFENKSRLPVRTNGEIPKAYVGELMKVLSRVIITEPVAINDVIIKNVLDTGIDIIATSNL